MFESLIDITRPLDPNTPIWPGDPAVRALPFRSIPADGARVTQIEMGTHSGTHMDAPSHFLEGGAGIDHAPLQAMVGKALVCAVGDERGLVNRAALSAALGNGHLKRLLLRTRSVAHRSGAWIDTDAALYLAKHGVRLIGTEGMSIEAPDGSGAVHRALLGAGIVILEYVDLSHVEPGIYNLIALPLRLTDLDAAPCRAILASVGAHYRLTRRSLGFLRTENPKCPS